MSCFCLVTLCTSLATLNFYIFHTNHKLADLQSKLVCAGQMELRARWLYEKMWLIEQLYYRLLKTAHQIGFDLPVNAWCRNSLTPKID